MSAITVADRYFDAWNARDPEAIAAMLAPDGTYSDPNVPEGLGPAGAAEYARSVFAGFSDLAFEIEAEWECGDGRVAARWLMTGTNDGPMMGLPPTGRSVRVPGADFVEVVDDRVRSVVGYFDTAAIPRQIGLQVVVQPSVVGPFTFGTSTYVSKAPTQPGAVSLTVLEARSPEEVDEVRAASRDVVTDLLGRPGFISWIGVNVGDRMFTITAWETPADVERLRDVPAHAAAMKRFFASPGLARGGQTGVWSPARLNGLWARCEVCGQMVAAGGTCECPEPTPAAVAYW